MEPEESTVTRAFSIVCEGVQKRAVQFMPGNIAGVGTGSSPISQGTEKFVTRAKAITSILEFAPLSCGQSTHSALPKVCGSSRSEVKRLPRLNDPVAQDESDKLTFTAWK